MFLWLLTFYQTGPNGLFIFYQVFNLILQSAKIFFIKIIPLFLFWLGKKSLVTLANTFRYIRCYANVTPYIHFHTN
jgi:hypothetical protein